MQIRQGRNRFYIGDRESEPLAEITFDCPSIDVIEVNHTYVSDELRGQGIAAKLVERVVEYAREGNMRIIPTCPYVKKTFAATDAYDDVWKK